jgi:hypothetical protein
MGRMGGMIESFVILSLHYMETLDGLDLDPGITLGS